VVLAAWNGNNQPAVDRRLAKIAILAGTQSSIRLSNGAFFRHFSRLALTAFAHASIYLALVYQKISLSAVVHTRDGVSPSGRGREFLITALSKREFSQGNARLVGHLADSLS